MKSAAIILLAAVCAAAAAVILKQRSTIASVLAATEANRMAFSNQMNQVGARLALHAGTNHLAVSNLLHLLETRTIRMHSDSNRIAQADQELRKERGDQRVLLARQAELAAQLKQFSALEARLREAHDQNTALAVERNRLAMDLQRVRLELAEVNRKLGDPDFLELQLEKAEAGAGARRRAATLPVKDSDPRPPVESPPDRSAPTAPPDATRKPGQRTVVVPFRGGPR